MKIETQKIPEAIEAQKDLFYKHKELRHQIQVLASYIQNDLSLYTRDELIKGLKDYRETMSMLLSDLNSINFETINLLYSYIGEERAK